MIAHQITQYLKVKHKITKGETQFTCRGTILLLLLLLFIDEYLHSLLLSFIDEYLHPLKWVGQAYKPHSLAPKIVPSCPPKTPDCYILKS